MEQIEVFAIPKFTFDDHVIIDIEIQGVLTSSGEVSIFPLNLFFNQTVPENRQLACSVLKHLFLNQRR